MKNVRPPESRASGQRGDRTSLFPAFVATRGNLCPKGHGLMSEKSSPEKDADANRKRRQAPVGSGKSLKGSLTMLGTAAVLTVYAAGYARTESAARRLADEEAARRQSATFPEPPSPVAMASSSVGNLDSTAAVSVTAPPVPADMASASEPESDEAPSSVGPPSDSEAVASNDSEPRPTETNATTATRADSATTTVAAAPMYKDGTYKGLGWRMRHGQIEATVEIAGGKIVSAAVSMCDMRWPCSDIDELVARVPRLQSSNVGMVGGATQSSEAFTSAVFQALVYAKAALQEPTSIQ